MKRTFGSEEVSSFWLSATVKFALEKVQISLKSGECELFPNPKKYMRQGAGFSNYAPVRLPMQPNSGFYPLDEDLMPMEMNLENWLDEFDKLPKCRILRDIFARR